MRTETVTLFFAILALAALAFAVVTAVAWVLRRSVPGFWDELVATAGPAGMWTAAVVALVATGGSLYLSEGAHFIPCRLCWYQRIGMYPLVVVCGVAALRRDLRAWPYPLVLALVTLPISIYHVLLERYPSLETGVCEVTNPCTIVWVKHFGFVTIPFMAASGFLAITASMVLARAWTRRSIDEEDEEEEVPGVGT
jgi:disulfide bond formation protein DsbB